MNDNAKISPAFGPFLSETGPNEKRDAIVVYRGAPTKGLPLRGRLRALNERLKLIELRAKAQKPFEEELLKKYRKASRLDCSGNGKLEADPIGQSALPIAQFEVTRSTLASLAHQSEVLAILPSMRDNCGR